MLFGVFRKALWCFCCCSTSCGHWGGKSSPIYFATALFTYNTSMLSALTIGRSRSGTVLQLALSSSLIDSFWNIIGKRKGVHLGISPPPPCPNILSSCACRLSKHEACPLPFSPPVPPATPTSHPQCVPCGSKGFHAHKKVDPCRSSSQHRAELNPARSLLGAAAWFRISPDTLLQTVFVAFRAAAAAALWSIASCCHGGKLRVLS